MPETVDPVRNRRLAMALVADTRPKYLKAALAGMPANVLSGIVAGRIKATAAQQQRLADVLGTTVTDLFGGE